MSNTLEEFTTEQLIDELKNRSDIFGIKVFTKEWIKPFFYESKHKMTDRSLKKVKDYPYTQNLFEISEKDCRMIETAIGDALD